MRQEPVMAYCGPVTRWTPTGELGWALSADGSGGVIRSFGGKDTERIWHEQYVKSVDRTVQRAALRKLELIHAAKDVEDLRIPPGTGWSGWSATVVGSTASG